GSFTWYNTGLGACGLWNSDNELVVAMAKANFDPETPGGNPNNNRLCGRRIRATGNGVSVDVSVVDRCEGCAWGDLDFSPAAFRQFASLDIGRISGTWEWI
ncbi:RlpA-like double-psi beta-barrel-protein domain-containing protein-containing protein, partial [Lasiosphaeris hirsuta]